ncbi:MAG: peptidase MA family metallohydrolase [Bacteroidetes bacterium]|nr:peptidase MA family metallohydrolase [Bacteroidota bacterium]
MINQLLKLKLFFILFFALQLNPLIAQDGVFGKNKVQYKNFVWSYIQTEHFDIYYYENGEYLSKFTASAAESAYASISKKIRHTIANRIPIMIYNSHNDFQQTNVVSEYMEEGIGGVTELFKNRVIVPFEGNYRQFRHVIHHELVHAVLNDMFYGGSIQSIISNNIQLQLPHWFNEGLSEYLALEWDVNSDMFMRDATLHTYLPPIEYLSGYFSYRAGQSVWYYIATKYGEQKISEILHRIKGMRNIDNGFKSAIGLNVKELDERWQKGLKVAYWPDISKRVEPKEFAQQLTNHTKDGNFYNTSPVLSPQGDKIAFISDRNDYLDLFVISTIDNKIKKVIDGQRTANFEELHLLTPGICWSPDGKKIAVATKSGDKDAIMIVDVESGEEEKLSFKNMEGIFSVDWSHAKNKLVFIGNTSIQSDIFTYDFKSKKLTNITNDIFSDLDPTWANDGETIYFSSDRNTTTKNMNSQNTKMWEYKNAKYDIYSINVNSGVIKQLTKTDYCDETNPIPSADNKSVLYVSDKSGIGNIYQLDFEKMQERPITNSITGLYQLSLSRDASKLTFSCLNEAGFDIFLVKNPFEKELKISSLEQTDFRKEQIFLNSPLLKSDSSKIISEPSIVQYGDAIQIDLSNSIFDTENLLQQNSTSIDTSLQITNNLDEKGNFRITKYKLNFSPDIIYATTAFSTYYGLQGTTVMAFSDMLGDHQIYFTTNLLSDLRNSDYSLGYFYLPEKIDYGFQGFHSARYLWLSNGLFRFRNWGFGGMATYPFDKFNRVDGSLMFLNLSREQIEYPPSEAIQRRQLIMPSISFIHDNSLWWILAPNNGRRINLTFSLSPFSGKNSLDFKTLTLDFRNYLRLFRTSSVATRFVGGLSVGKDPQHFIMGGTEGWINYEFDNNNIPIENVEDYVFLTPILPMRGFNYNVKNGTKYFLLNNEYRFQLIQLIVTGGVPLALQNILGAAFVDIGSAWSEDKYFKGVHKNINGQSVTKDLLMGMGVGTRFIFFGLPFKIDVAWTYDLQKFSKPRYYFSLGGDY